MNLYENQKTETFDLSMHKDFYTKVKHNTLIYL